MNALYLSAIKICSFTNVILVMRDELAIIASDQSAILQYDNYNQLYRLANDIIRLISQNCKSKKENNEWPMRRNVAPMSQSSYYSSNAYGRHLESSSSSYLAPPYSTSNEAADGDIDFMEWDQYNRLDKRHRAK